MAITTRTNWATELLTNYITRQVSNLEPLLHFLSFGLRQDPPQGNDRLTFPRVNRFTAANVSTLTEGTNPTTVAWGSVVNTVGPTQFGLSVRVSDLLVRNSAIEVVQNCVREVRLALARRLDEAAQTVVNAGTGVILAAGRAARVNLVAGDNITPDLIVRAVGRLRRENVNPVGGTYYPCIMHPNVATDLMLNTTAGGYIPVGVYTQPADLKEGKLGEFRGARVLQSANVATFASTVTVFPTTLFGDEPYGWGYFQQPTPILVTQPDSSNQLNLHQTIGAKATIGITRLQEEKIVRIESASAQ